MNVLIVHAHPEPTSFNAALTRAAAEAIEAAEHSVEISDLYAEGFDPVAGRHDFVDALDPNRFHYQSEQAHAATTGGFSSEIRREQDRVRRADILVLQFPLWWGGPPAILKGWCDRVLAYGFAYVDGRRFDSGLFKGRRALFSVTTGGTPQRFSESGVYGPMESVLYPVERLLLQYMGYDVLAPFVAYAAPRVGADEREAYLAAWRARIVDALATPVVPEPVGDDIVESVGPSPWSRPG